MGRALDAARRFRGLVRSRTAGVLDTATGTMVQAIKVDTPVDTGELVEGFQHERPSEFRHRIVNDVDHGPAQEFGTSTQPPRAMIRQNLPEWPEHVAAAARQVKGGRSR